jgi:lysophospholipase L1-like esterase
MKKYLLSGLLSLVFLFGSLNFIYRATDIQANNIKTTNSNKDSQKYLKKLQNQKISVIENEIKGSRKTNSNSSSNMVSEAKDYFKDSVFAGDSLTEAISFYGLLNSNNVVGIKGRNVYTALQDVDAISKVNAKRIFILYGMNDMVIYKSEKRFVKEYQKLIKAIRVKNPDAKIYIESILPVSASVQKKIPEYLESREQIFNNAVKDMCKSLKLNFIDVRSLIDSPNMYEPDGMHLKYDFYKKYVVYMMKNVQ